MLEKYKQYRMVQSEKSAPVSLFSAPVLPPPLPKDDHHYYHFNIFLLIFLTDIQTQKYMNMYVCIHYKYYSACDHSTL